MTAQLKKFPTLLLLTNEPSIRGFFERIITKIESHGLITVSTQSEALEYLDRMYIGLVVIDEKTLHLETGPLCTLIRDLKDHAHTPILVITAHLKKMFIRSLIKAGATDFLHEPLEEDECLLRIEIAHGIMETQVKMRSLSSRMPKKVSMETSLKHRAVMGDQAAKLVKQALSENTSLILLLIEIDQHFQLLENEGEDVAHTLALDFENHLRKLIRGQDLLYNQNSGKFAVFLPKTSSQASIFIAENISESLSSQIFSMGSVQSSVTLSIGIASLDQVSDPAKSVATNLERLAISASQCLAKASEKKDTIIFDPPNQGDSP